MTPIAADENLKRACDHQETALHKCMAQLTKGASSDR